MFNHVARPEFRSIIAFEVDAMVRYLLLVCAVVLSSSAVLIVGAEESSTSCATTLPRGSVQKRPTGVSSKPANGSGPERLEVVPDHELAMQGKIGLFPQSSKKIS
jgi:hypothetical protein